MLSFPNLLRLPIAAMFSLALFLCFSGCSEGDRVLIEETRPQFKDEPKPVFGKTAKERFLVDGGRGAGGQGGDGGEVTNPFRWDVPEGWTQLPSSRMRAINFKFGENDEGECYLTALPQTGGGILANVNRWRGQMGLDPLSEQEVAALPERTLLGRSASFIDIEGDFGGMSLPGAPPSDAKEDYRMLGLIQIQNPFTFFIKMTGPQALVAQNEEAFKQFCESIKIGVH